MKNLHDKRQSYEKSELLERNLKNTPMEQFHDWYLEAERNMGIFEANAMTVSTTEKDGCPRSRVILLKSFSQEGFVFYTNYESAKGISIAEMPKACLSFFWIPLERQVIIKAHLEKVPESFSDEYFSSRPRGSQLGALVSDQSKIIPNREFLENRLLELERTYDGREISRPKHWGGYIAKPYEIEFWQGRPNRLHDRILYRLNSEWEKFRLAP